MVKKRLIGYGITNSSGIATLDYDATGSPIEPSGYVGTGSGEIDIKAELHDDNTVQSEPYILYDTLFHDEMTPYTASKWSSTLTPTQNDDGITVAETSGTSTNFSASYTAIEDVIIEFDAIGVSVANNGVRFYYKGADHYINSYLTDSDWHHFKFVCENGTVTPYVDGTAKTSKSTTSNTTCKFILNNSSIKFKNFKVYSS